MIDRTHVVPPTLTIGGANAGRSATEQISTHLTGVICVECAILSQDGRIPHDIRFVDLSEALVSPRDDDCDPFSRWLFASPD
jgi:hypothetical protein